MVQSSEIFLDPNKLFATFYLQMSVHLLFFDWKTIFRLTIFTIYVLFFYFDRLDSSLSEVVFDQIAHTKFTSVPLLAISFELATKQPVRSS